MHNFGRSIFLFKNDSVLFKIILGSKIEGNNIYISAELFSIDGKERYYFKSSKNINLSKDLGKEVGEILKVQSMGSYKK